MKTCSTHGAARSMRLASSAWLALVLSVLAGAASADIIGGGDGSDLVIHAPVYLPHSDLTPYQLVSDNGRCLQSDFELNQAPDATVGLADCDDGNPMQKFYVLDYSAQSYDVSDFVPQTDGGPTPQNAGANARIALAGLAD